MNLCGRLFLVIVSTQYMIEKGKEEAGRKEQVIVPGNFTKIMKPLILPQDHHYMSRSISVLFSLDSNSSNSQP